MKILISTDPEIPVPPDLYGGAERVAYNLIIGLSNKGHQIILLAHPSSNLKNTGKLYGWKKLLSRGYNNVWANAWQLLKIIRKEKPDIVVCFSRILYIYPSWLFTRKKFIKRYGRYISPKSNALANVIMGNRIHYTPNAWHMIEHLPGKNKYTAIYSGVDTNFYYDDDKTEKTYLLFLGRIEDIKGTKEAVEAAIQANEKLIVAGNYHDEHRDYFEKYVQSFVSRSNIEYAGPVNNEQKRKLLQGARALLQPFKLDVEAFPSTVIEGLACGTPVIGFGIPAIKEAITHGENGFIVENVNGMVDAIQCIPIIDRKKVRQSAVSHFSLEKVATDYEKLILSFLNKKKH